MNIKSAAFDDIYFSPEDGLAESRHVFLQGNNFPQAWANRPRFTIVETGFGTGLNFLAVHELFRRTTSPDKRLHYVSFEKYPLRPDDIRHALARWQDTLPGLARLIKIYPLRVPGFHRVLFDDRVTLTLIFDDVNEALPQLDAPQGIDAWFLDGFAPAKNPYMWTPTVFEQMARLSRPGTTLATFTVAGAVKNGLAAAGFTVKKIKGYGRKREMLTGVFESLTVNPHPVRAPQRIAVIGGGLAGCAAAYALKKSGLTPVIFESSPVLASAASGNPLGLYNPRLSALRTSISDFYGAAFAGVARMMADIQRRHNIEFDPCGSLHLLTDDDRRRKGNGAAQTWNWSTDHLSMFDASAASAVAGISLSHEAVYLPDAGTISPAALCHAYADEIEVQTNTKIVSLDDIIDFDAVILACGTSVRKFAPHLPTGILRGQITQISATPDTQNLKTNLCYGGYLAPARSGTHTLGATFDRNDTDTDVRDEDDLKNIKSLNQVINSHPMPDVVGRRAALRITSRDHAPFIGQIAPGLYASAAHGSHGIVSSLAAAHLLTDLLTGGVRSLSRDTIARIDPVRVKT